MSAKLHEKMKKNGKARPKNMAVLYLLCIIIPLIVTDGIFIFLLVKSDKNAKQYTIGRTAEAIEYQFKNNIDYMVTFSNNIAMSSEVNDFLDREYESDYEYFVNYFDVMKNPYVKNQYNLYKISTEMYTDNDTIIPGGGVYPLKSAENTGWYKAFLESGKNSMILFYYDEDSLNSIDPRRRLLFITRMLYHQQGKKEKIVKLSFDYPTFSRNFESLAGEADGIIAQNGKIAIETAGGNNHFDDFRPLDLDNIAMIREFSSCGSDFSIVILDNDDMTFTNLQNNKWSLFILIVVNAIFPMVFSRLSSSLHKERIKQQEADIARQNAELLALHSQINPHFLFNALESIRMHSVIKGEEETAEMVQKLAVIERTNADWDKDFTYVTDEMNFVDAYLKLQQYRFGDRLSYEIDVDEDCEKIRLPRLTIVTFVENACVHGIEGKSSPGWIFVRVYRKENDCIIEVEDTGEGIGEEELLSLKYKMENASIEMLKEKGRIGVINACLRLKMETENQVRFVIESEEGIGTTIQIIIPLDKLMIER